MKEIKREFSVPRTSQQNGITKRKNKTLIKTARTMLADSLLPIPFWAEVVNTACYVQNRVLVTKPHNKTPYELLLGRTPSIGFMRPFGCSVAILNTLDPLGKFDGNADEGFFVGYSEAGHVNFKTMNKLVKGNLVRGLLSKTFENDHTCVTCQKGKQHKASYSLLPTIFWAEAVNTACYILNRILVTKPHNKTPYELIIGSLSIISFMRPFGCPVTILNTLDPLGKFDGKEKEGFLVSSAKTKKHDDKTKREAKGKSLVELSTGYRNLSTKFEDFSYNSINEVNAASTPIPTVGQILTNNTNTFSAAGPSNTAVSPTHGKSSYMDPSQYPDDLNMPALEDITYFDDDEDVGAEADFTNFETTITVSPIPTTRVHKDHHVSIDNYYNVFAMESKHPEQSISVHDTYPIDQDAQNVIIDSLDMSYDREEINQNDEDNDLANERELLASLIEKLKCEIDESKNRNKFLETSNKVLIEKLKGEIKDFKTKNKSLEPPNNRFKEANNKLSETNNLLFTDYKKSKAELVRRNSM
nr:retrovirus-related Pol polyprotein from transposon TNT 1-94 [Tanacetum cinerariifolium]